MLRKTRENLHNVILKLLPAGKSAIGSLAELNKIFGFDGTHVAHLTFAITRNALFSSGLVATGGGKGRWVTFGAPDRLAFDLQAKATLVRPMTHTHHNTWPTPLHWRYGCKP